jgi:hypothetical protein
VWVRVAAWCALLVLPARGGGVIPVDVGVRLRRNDARHPGFGRVVRVEGVWAVVLWDHGRLSTVHMGKVRAGGRPCSSGYSIIEEAA